MRGRKPTPRALKLITGNCGRRPITHPGAFPRALDHYPAPDWLSPRAQEEWRRLEPELRAGGLLTVLDLACFAGLCSELATFAEINEAIAKQRTRSPMRLGPLIGMRRKSGEAVRRWAQEFGLSPVARERISEPQPPKDDPVAKYIPPARPS
jgi:P27 family predicted phage terminase small subunit